MVASLVNSKECKLTHAGYSIALDKFFPLYDPVTLTFDRLTREAKRRYRRSQCAADRQAFHTARAAVRAAITRSRTDAVKQRFDEASGDAAATWRRSARRTSPITITSDRSTATASVRRWRLVSADELWRIR